MKTKDNAERNREKMRELKKNFKGYLESAEYIFDEDLDGEPISQVLALGEVETWQADLKRVVELVFDLDWEDGEKETPEREADRREAERIIKFIDTAISEGEDIIREGGEGDDYENALREALEHIRQRLL